MNFSVAQVWVDGWLPVAVYLCVVALYAGTAALAGRRFGGRGVWGACAAWTLVVFAAGAVSDLGGGPTRGWLIWNAVFALLAAAAPGAASAALISRLGRGTRPAALPLQVVAGVLAYLALPLAVVALMIVAFGP